VAAIESSRQTATSGSAWRRMVTLRRESSRSAPIDARRPVSGASGDGGAPSAFFGGRGDACGGARLLQPPQEVPLDYLKLLLMLGWVLE
jgi:hypothetical protein